MSFVRYEVPHIFLGFVQFSYEMILSSDIHVHKILHMT